MPLIIPKTLPAYDALYEEHVFVMHRERAACLLYTSREQNEEHFWSLMNALNYALELQTKVMVPLDAAVDPQSGAAPWANLPIPEDRAEGLPPWLLQMCIRDSSMPAFERARKGKFGILNATGNAVSVLLMGLAYLFVCLKAYGGAFCLGAVTQYVGCLLYTSRCV